MTSFGRSESPPGCSSLIVEIFFFFVRDSSSAFGLLLIISFVRETGVAGMDMSLELLAEYRKKYLFLCL